MEMVLSNGFYEMTLEENMLVDGGAVTTDVCKFIVSSMVSTTTGVVANKVGASVGGKIGAVLGGPIGFVGGAIIGGAIGYAVAELIIE